MCILHIHHPKRVKTYSIYNTTVWLQNGCWVQKKFDLRSCNYPKYLSFYSNNSKPKDWQPSNTFNSGTRPPTTKQFGNNLSKGKMLPNHFSYSMLMLHKASVDANSSRRHHPSTVKNWFHVATSDVSHCSSFEQTVEFVWGGDRTHLWIQIDVKVFFKRLVTLYWSEVTLMKLESLLTIVISTDLFLFVFARHIF